MITIHVNTLNLCLAAEIVTWHPPIMTHPSENLRRRCKAALGDLLAISLVGEIIAMALGMISPVPFGHTWGNTLW
jgi:hypothetical protein